MSRTHRSWWQPSLLLSGALVVEVCGNAASAEQPSDALAAPLQTAFGSSTAPQGACDAVATAGAGWLDTFIPVSTGVFTSSFRVYPTEETTWLQPNTDSGLF
jgi:hypothetical protein